MFQILGIPFRDFEKKYHNIVLLISVVIIKTLTFLFIRLFSQTYSFIFSSSSCPVHIFFHLFLLFHFYSFSSTSFLSLSSCPIPLLFLVFLFFLYLFFLPFYAICVHCSLFLNSIFFIRFVSFLLIPFLHFFYFSFILSFPLTLLFVSPLLGRVKVSVFFLVLFFPPSEFIFLLLLF